MGEIIHTQIGPSISMPVSAYSNSRVRVLLLYHGKSFTSYSILKLTCCSYHLQETMEDMDKNRDGFVSVEEYISKLTGHLHGIMEQ